jgi:hypothetical protein
MVSSTHAERDHIRDHYIQANSFAFEESNVERESLILKLTKVCFPLLHAGGFYYIFLDFRSFLWYKDTI